MKLYFCSVDFEYAVIIIIDFGMLVDRYFLCSFLYQTLLLQH